MEWLPIISAATSAASALMGASNNAATAESQAQAADYNAAIQRQNAETALAQGNANEETQRRKARIIAGQQRAAIAEAGIGFEGSGSDLYQQSVENAEMDAVNIRYNAQLAAAGYKNQAGLDAWNADQNRANASRIQSAGILSAGAAALSGYGAYDRGDARIKAASKGAA